METGIIGLPLSGKTTFFNALTGMSAETGGYSGGAKAANVSDVEVPDERVDRLTELFKPKKKVLATVRFKDLQAEFTPQAGLNAAAIAELRNCEAIALIVRAFVSEAVPHPLESVDPLRDFRRLMDSLVFSDYAVAEKRMERIVKEGKKGDREYQKLEKVLKILEEGRPIGSKTLSEEDQKLFSGFAFLTSKPMVVVANTGESSVDTAALEEEVQQQSLALFRIQGVMEMEIAQLPPEDQKSFLADIGLQEPAKNRFLHAIYDQLHLMSFLTAGEDECRAWSIPRDTPAVKAAGKIHTDLEKGFIRAEVIEWQKLLEAGGFKEAKTAGWLRLEGKEYIVKDGDVINIRFNV